MKRQIVFWACFLLSFMVVNAQEVVYKDHVIQAGETLYSLAKSYGTSVDEIRTANPQLGETYQIGQQIRIPTIEVKIPDCKQTYKVKKKETLYSISKQFGLTVDELVNANPVLRDKTLKKNMEICIPYSTQEKDAMQPQPTVIMPDEVKIAVFLPFGLNKSVKTKEACTMVDFYEGFLLSVQDMKKKGIATTIYSYDETDVDKVLQRPEMKELDIIIGPKEISNISLLTRFCQSNKAVLVVPFSSQDYIVNNAPHVFQVNTKLDNRYDRVFEEFSRLYRNFNIVFVAMGDEDNEMSKAVQMRRYLDKQGITYKNIIVDELTPDSKVLLPNKQNVVIPLSSTQKGFEQICAKLEVLPISAERITLYGYTDWQAFASKYKTKFATYHCTYFTAFYHNPDASQVVNFNNRFHNQFSRDQFNTYPRYGMLGYDVGTYFIQNFYEQGNKFFDKITSLRSKAMQNPMRFVKKNSTSGYINNALMKVTYNTDGSVSVEQL